MDSDFDSVRDSLPWALVVDDDDGVRRLVARLLERDGYRVLSAATAERALEVLDEHPSRIALLVSDVELPGMPGPDLVRQATSLWPGLATVLMSGAGAGYLVQRGRIAAGTPLLEKPFLALELTQAVDRALREAERQGRRSHSGIRPAVASLQNGRAARRRS